MNPQPTIFISSIVSEFYDLRGSLKYFLGKSGFRVLLSEEADFGADCGSDSLDNCLRQIEKSDYYFLLIGNNPGTIFKSEMKDTTVTFEEFRHYVSLVKAGKNLNLISFVRQQTWDNYTKKDTSLIHPLQIELIDELIHNSLFEQNKIGRWRYTFDRFTDIISVLETNQNGLFLEATRKSNIYRTYLKREITDILKLFVEKDKNTNNLQTTTDYLNLTDIKFIDFLDSKFIEKGIAIKIKVFLVINASRGTLLRKINRVFNYIAQGEFSKFEPLEEKYSLPEYIKLTIQTLVILEKVFENSKNNEIFEQVRNRDANNFYINQAEYWLIYSNYTDLKTAIQKLINLVNCFYQNWSDLEKRPDEFYSYRGSVVDKISDQDIIDFAKDYYK